MIVEPPEEVEVAVAARVWMDSAGSTVPDSFSQLAEDTLDENECMAFAGDVAYAGASPVAFAGDAAVALALPAVARAASPAVLAKGVAADGRCRDGHCWGELPADLAGVATVGVASLADARKVTFGVADLAVAGAASLADAGGMFPAVSAERVTMGVTDLTDVYSVNVVGVQTCASSGDRLSPGVWCRDKTLIQQNFDFRPDYSMCCDGDETYCSVAVGAPETLLCDLGCPLRRICVIGRDLKYWGMTVMVMRTA